MLKVCSFFASHSNLCFSELVPYVTSLQYRCSEMIQVPALSGHELEWKCHSLCNTVTGLEKITQKQLSLNRVQLSQGPRGIYALDFALGPKLFRLEARNSMCSNQKKSCFWPLIFIKRPFWAPSLKCQTLSIVGWFCSIENELWNRNLSSFRAIMYLGWLHIIGS